MIDANVISLIKSELRRYNTHLEIEQEAAKEQAEDANSYLDSVSYEEAPLKFKIDDCSS